LDLTRRPAEVVVVVVVLLLLLLLLAVVPAFSGPALEEKGEAEVLESEMRVVGWRRSWCQSTTFCNHCFRESSGVDPCSLMMATTDDDEDDDKTFPESGPFVISPWPSSTSILLAVPPSSS
jgi:hypothetical protein